MSQGFVKRNFVTEKSFYKATLAILVPIALQNIISFGVNMMDTVMLGQVGEVAISAASLGAQPFFLLMGLSFGLSSGGAVLIAQYWGKSNKEAIRTIMSISMRIMLAGAVVFTVLCQLWPQQIMAIYTKDPAVQAAAGQYLRIVSLSFIFYCAANNYMMSQRAVESVKFSTLIYCGSFFVNVFFNYCLIFGKLGFPRLEVAGAAWGTTIARFFEFCCAMFYMLFLEKKVGFRPRDLFRKAGVLFGDYVKHAVPVVGNELMWSMGSTALSIIIGHISSAFVAANSISGIVMQLSSVFIFGVANAAAVLTGKAIGAGKMADAQKMANTLWLMSFCLGVFASILTLLVRTPLLTLYSVSQETKDIAFACMGALAIMQPIIALDSTAVVGILRGGGDTRTALFLDCGTLWLVAVPLGALTGLVLHWAPPLVYLMIKMDSPVKTIMAGIRIFSGKWVRVVTRDNVK